MKKIFIEIYDVPPSNNMYQGQNKRWAYAKEKKRWASLIKESVTEIPEKPFERARIHITYTFPDRRRRDPDNYSGKFLFDPLVRIGIIKDDCFGVIFPSFDALVEKGVKKTLIEVEEF